LNYSASPEDGGSVVHRNFDELASDYTKSNHKIILFIIVLIRPAISPYSEPMVKANNEKLNSHAQNFSMSIISEMLLLAFLIGNELPCLKIDFPLRRSCSDSRQETSGLRSCGLIMFRAGLIRDIL
jgi:hypothetical protein